MNAILLFFAGAIGVLLGGIVGATRLRAQRTRGRIREQTQAQAARDAIVRQLSHDLRSPLTALETVLDTSRGLSEQDRMLICAATTRMRDMANTLAPSTSSAVSQGAEPLQLEVEFAVSQLRQRLRAQGHGGIDLRLDKQGFSTAFTQASRDALCQSLREAIRSATRDFTGVQTLLVRCAGPNVEVHNITVANVQRFTPKTAQSAAWFMGTLGWPQDGTVVITDDDEAVHAAWHTRLKVLPSHQAPRLIHLKALTALTEYVAQLSDDDMARHVFWVDCEFTGSIETGLDAIARLNIGNRSVLCTSHYDEDRLRKGCIDLGAKLLPKTLLHTIPLAPRTDDTVVLIDDDTLIHQVWQLAAHGKQLGLRTFVHPDEFLRDIDSYARNTPIYIDSQLGAGLRGEDIARTVFSQGFGSVYITTGSDPAEFPAMPWVKDILGKEPPF